MDRRHARNHQLGLPSEPPEPGRTASRNRRSTSSARGIAAASVNLTAAKARRSILLDLVISAVARLATRPGDRPTPDRAGLAPQRLPSLLAMEEPQTRAGKAGGLARRESTDPQESVSNPGWGAPRIHGELLKLGFDVGETSVAKYMIRRRKPPSQTWRTFLENHLQ